MRNVVVKIKSIMSTIIEAIMQTSEGKCIEVIFQIWIRVI